MQSGPSAGQSYVNKQNATRGWSDLPKIACGPVPRYDKYICLLSRNTDKARHLRSPVRLHGNPRHPVVNPAAKVSDGVDQHSSRTVGPAAAPRPAVDPARPAGLPSTVDAPPLELFVERQRGDASANGTPVGRGWG